MKNVLFVLHHPEFGGPHNQALRLSKPLEELGWRTIVALPAEAESTAARLGAAGVRVVRMPMVRIRRIVDPIHQLRWAAGFVADIVRLRRLIRIEHIELVMICGIANGQAAFAARLAGVPVVWQIVDTRTPKALRWLMMPLVLQSNAIMTTGIAVARQHRTNLVGNRKLVPFYPPVDTDGFTWSRTARDEARRELGLDGERLIIGNVSNVNPQKGHGTFLRAAALLKEKVGGVQFVIMGATYAQHSAYTRSLWQLAGRLGLRPGVDYLVVDPHSRVNQLACAFDLFWLTSEPHSEGIPTAVEEAMALSLPVVVADVGSLRELVEDGVSGIVVSPNDPQAFASATQNLIGDRPRMAAMGSAARERVMTLASIEASALAHLRAFEIAAAPSNDKQMRAPEMSLRA